MDKKAETKPDLELKADAKPKKGSIKPKLRPPELPGFDKFWQLYPRKDARIDALKAWHQNGCEPHVEIICAGVRRQRGGFKPGFTAMGATYINGARWEDQGQVAGQKPGIDAYSQGTEVTDTPPGTTDPTMCSLNRLMRDVLMENKGVHGDCLDQMILKKKYIREWIGDRVLNKNQAVLVAARAKARWKEIIREFNAGLDTGSAPRNEGRERHDPRALASESADYVGDAW